jgi:hypothetical protein
VKSLIKSFNIHPDNGDTLNHLGNKCFFLPEIIEWDENDEGLLWTDEKYSDYLKNNFPFSYIAEGFGNESNNKILYNQLADSIALAN